MRIFGCHGAQIMERLPQNQGHHPRHFFRPLIGSTKRVQLNKAGKADQLFQTDSVTKLTDRKVT
jgi:hypothetical protein